MALPDGITLPEEFSAVEDVVLPLVRAGLPESIPVKSLIKLATTFPLVVIRRGDTVGDWRGDDRFVDDVDIVVHTFASDPDGDSDAARLAEAVRIILRDAHRQQTVVPGRGHLSSYHMTNAPHRAPDWSTSSGPVQFADLPSNVQRYETRYHLSIRKPPILGSP